MDYSQLQKLQEELDQKEKARKTAKPQTGKTESPQTGLPVNPQDGKPTSLQDGKPVNPKARKRVDSNPNVVLSIDVLIISSTKKRSRPGKSETASS